MTVYPSVPERDQGIEAVARLSRYPVFDTGSTSRLPLVQTLEAKVASFASHILFAKEFLYKYDAYENTYRHGGPDRRGLIIIYLIVFFVGRGTGRAAPRRGRCPSGSSSSSNGPQGEGDPQEGRRTSGGRFGGKGEEEEEEEEEEEVAA